MERQLRQIKWLLVVAAVAVFVALVYLPTLHKNERAADKATAKLCQINPAAPECAR